MNTSSNADPRELDKFGELAHRWWDPNSEFRPLHDINPARLAWIDAHAGLEGKRAIDIGCGGGLLSEGMAALGAQVTGIDLSEKALSIARLHLYESGQTVDYRLISAEAMAAEAPAGFDLVTCLEMLEHVPDPASTVAACAQLVKPGGQVFLSTINRNPKAYLLAVVGAEYVFNLLPRGTHDYTRFLKPAELARLCRDAGLEVLEITGLRYNPLKRDASIGADTDVNYLLRARRNA
ncbi:MAG: 2-polyprenyl-6-hydroxyphenyl methylase / 3-demethylubiquinone-9 3-methyltransferase [Rhodocyclaceae bacterium]|nr:MAG: 2-polyprenyl-6-hydroxyphenyl methylase / 3-demethylubiquinone-9 3-methyltransferase [Rhodocyclaceae bacterium]TND05385.1 MAG: 2-polyprenyl-6-hydroxyphenyl methylase / 3-demethylubiquinone-9 3-methyltransferase [Rhodocyclaceae bacterium]